MHPSLAFLNYRRLDSGADFPAAISEKINQANVFLVIRGPDRLSHLNQYQAEQKTDWFKLELQQALARCDRGEQLAIIPLLVDAVRRLGRAYAKPSKCPII